VQEGTILALSKVNDDRRNRPIGVFDSGMGGLTVMRALQRRLPNEEFVYLGDTARLPYGTKSPETVTRYALQCSAALAPYDVKLLVVACNTASAFALPALSEKMAPVPVLGVIEPGAEAALAGAPEGRVLVLATESTVRGGAYPKAIRARNPDAEVRQVPCPLFVALAEEGLLAGPAVEWIVRNYIGGMLEPAPAPESVLLGCTHFPALAEVIAKVAGPAVKLVDSAETTATATELLLNASGLARPEGKHEPPRFLVTDAPERFARVGATFLGEHIDRDRVELVDLQSLPRRT
jgi:glutamate racemase